MTATPAMMRGAKPPAPRETPGAIPPPSTSAAAPDELSAGVADHRRNAPIYGVQYIRREAVRLAIESYADEERPTDDTLISTADRIAEFIRSGNTLGH